MLSRSQVADNRRERTNTPSEDYRNLTKGGIIMPSSRETSPTRENDNSRRRIEQVQEYRRPRLQDFTYNSPSSKESIRGKEKGRSLSNVSQEGNDIKRIKVGSDGASSSSDLQMTSFSNEAINDTDMNLDIFNRQQILGQNRGISFDNEQASTKRDKVYSNAVWDKRYKDYVIEELKQNTGIAWGKAIQAVEGTKKNKSADVRDLDEYSQALDYLRTHIKQKNPSETQKEEAGVAIGIVRDYTMREVPVAYRDGISQFLEVFRQIDESVIKKVGELPDIGKSNAIESKDEIYQKMIKNVGNRFKDQNYKQDLLPISHQFAEFEDEYMTYNIVQSSSDINVSMEENNGERKENLELVENKQIPKEFHDDEENRIMNKIRNIHSLTLKKAITVCKESKTATLQTYLKWIYLSQIQVLQKEGKLVEIPNELEFPKRDQEIDPELAIGAFKAANIILEKLGQDDTKQFVPIIKEFQRVNNECTSEIFTQVSSTTATLEGFKESPLNFGQASSYEESGVSSEGVTVLETAAILRELSTGNNHEQENIDRADLEQMFKKLFELTPSDIPYGSEQRNRWKKISDNFKEYYELKEYNDAYVTNKLSDAIGRIKKLQEIEKHSKVFENFLSERQSGLEEIQRQISTQEEVKREFESQVKNFASLVEERESSLASIDVSLTLLEPLSSTEEVNQSRKRLETMQSEVSEKKEMYEDQLETYQEELDRAKISEKGLIEEKKRYKESIRILGVNCQFAAYTVKLVENMARQIFQDCPRAVEYFDQEPQASLISQIALKSREQASYREYEILRDDVSEFSDLNEENNATLSWSSLLDGKFRIKRFIDNLSKGKDIQDNMSDLQKQELGSVLSKLDWQYLQEMYDSDLSFCKKRPEPNVNRKKDFADKQIRIGDLLDYHLLGNQSAQMACLQNIIYRVRDIGYITDKQDFSDLYLALRDALPAELRDDYPPQMRGEKDSPLRELLEKTKLTATKIDPDLSDVNLQGLEEEADNGKQSRQRKNKGKEKAHREVTPSQRQSVNSKSFSKDSHSKRRKASDEYTKQLQKDLYQDGKESSSSASLSLHQAVRISKPKALSELTLKEVREKQRELHSLIGGNSNNAEKTQKIYDKVFKDLDDVKHWLEESKKHTNKIPKTVQDAWNRINEEVMGSRLTFKMKEIVTKLTGRLIEIDPDKLAGLRTAYDEMTEENLTSEQITAVRKKIQSQIFSTKNLFSTEKPFSIEKVYPYNVNVYDDLDTIKNWPEYFRGESDVMPSNNPIEALKIFNQIKEVAINKNAPLAMKEHLSEITGRLSEIKRNELPPKLQTAYDKVKALDSSVIQTVAKSIENTLGKIEANPKRSEKSYIYYLYAAAEVRAMKNWPEYFREEKSAAPSDAPLRPLYAYNNIKSIIAEDDLEINTYIEDNELREEISLSEDLKKTLRKLIKDEDKD